MKTSETTYRVRGSSPSSLRTELNVVAAVVAVGICLVILALLANAPARHSVRPPHNPHTWTHTRAVAATSAASRS